MQTDIKRIFCFSFIFYIFQHYCRKFLSVYFTRCIYFVRAFILGLFVDYCCTMGPRWMLSTILLNSCLVVSLTEADAGLTGITLPQDRIDKEIMNTESSCELTWIINAEWMKPIVLWNFFQNVTDATLRIIQISLYLSAIIENHSTYLMYCG